MIKRTETSTRNVFESDNKKYITNIAKENYFGLELDLH